MRATSCPARLKFALLMFSINGIEKTVAKPINSNNFPINSNIFTITDSLALLILEKTGIFPLHTEIL
jgi:hypothetical protein